MSNSVKSNTDYNKTVCSRPHFLVCIRYDYRLRRQMRGSCQPQRVQMMILLYVDDSFQIHTEQAHWEASLLLLQHVKASDFCQHNSPLCVIIPWVVPIARYHFPYSTVYALKSPTTRISDMFLQILWCDHTMAGKMILLEGHILNNSL